MQIVSIGDNLHCETLFPGKSKKNISEFCLFKTLLRVLSKNISHAVSELCFAGYTLTSMVG